MSSISPSTFSTYSFTSNHPQKLTISPRFSSPPLKPLHFHSHSRSRTFDSSSLHRCHSHSSSGKGGWFSLIQDAIRRVHQFLNSLKEEPGAEPDWDWDRWKKHFDEVDDQERILSTLKRQLDYAVNREDYEGAARLKVAIAAASSYDTVGRVISHLNKAIKEERYKQAALIRDHAGAGLVGWWSGISENSNDPYGRIIRITAEHGRYVARGYTPRQLASSLAGPPLFEIFLTVDKKGEYKQQAVYLKRRRVSEDSLIIPPRSSTATTPSRLSALDSTEDRSDLIATDNEDSEDNEDMDDDSDAAVGFQNILREMIPGVKVKVLKVNASEKVNRDMISKVIEQIMDEEDDTDLENVETENETIGEGGQQQDEIDMDSGEGFIDDEEQFGISVKLGGALVQKLSSGTPSKNLLRVPARVQKKGRRSFSFSIDEDASRQDATAKDQALDKKSQLLDERNIDNVMFDLAKAVGTQKIPLKVLKDINRLIHFTLTQAQNHQPLTDTTTFKRLEIPASPDPLNGLYIGAHGLYTSEVIQLRCKFGQWKEDGGKKESSSIEFYEYVEAIKLTGDPYVPAGQVAFRAKVGKRNQLPHRGIIPEEFGVIARYRGQGRLAEPGYRNPRWVDGELVILDGKYIKGGPVIGFVYWAPEYHFLVFFNPLRLQE